MFISNSCKKTWSKFSSSHRRKTKEIGCVWQTRSTKKYLERERDWEREREGCNEQTAMAARIPFFFFRKCKPMRMWQNNTTTTSQSEDYGQTCSKTCHSDARAQNRERRDALISPCTRWFRSHQNPALSRSPFGEESARTSNKVGKKEEQKWNVTRYRNTNVAIELATAVIHSALESHRLLFCTTFFLKQSSTTLVLCCASILWYCASILVLHNPRATCGGVFTQEYLWPWD